MADFEFDYQEIGGVPIACCDKVARQRIDELAAASGVTYFGRVWNLANSTPVADHYVGNLAFGQTLPEWLGLGCYIVKADHTRKKLMASNHYKYEDGTPAKLDGTDGHYQWGWCKKFYIVVKQQGDELALIIAKGKIPGEYNYEIPIASESAAGWATMERSTGKLVSYINMGTNYRGGNNNSALDGLYNTQLGMPASNMTTNAFLNAAHLNGDGWLGACMRFECVKAILFYVIMGNLNAQAAFNANLDANGLHQGGLGTGPTNAGGWWGKAVAEGGFGYYPAIPLSAGISMGDGLGTFTYDVKDANGDTLQTMNCTCFFGLKNGVGGIMWKMMTDELFVCQEDKSQKHYFASKICKVDGNWTYSIAESLTGFTEGGQTPVYETAALNYITRVLFKNLQLMPLAVGGGDTNRFSDVYYNPAATSGFRLVLRSGSLSYGGLCGLSFVHGLDGVGRADAHHGSSLCEAAEEWKAEAEYVEV